MSRHSRPVLTNLYGKNVEEFKNIDEVVFIGYISSGDEAAQQMLSNVASKYRNEFSFALVSDEEVIQSQNMASPTVICHVPEDEETRSLSAFENTDALDSFVAASSRRVIGELTPHNYQRLHDVCLIAALVQEVLVPRADRQ